MRIGYFEHWFRPQWSFIEFIREQGFEVEKIDYSQKNYLEKYDMVIIEQNGFNDYIEMMNSISATGSPAAGSSGSCTRITNAGRRTLCRMNLVIRS